MAIPTYTWGQAAQGGGGGVNCVDGSPFDVNKLMAGGDISGWSYSSDLGQSWIGRRWGSDPDAQAGTSAVCGAVEFSRTESNLIWGGSKTGFFVWSESSGKWTRINAGPSFGDGGGNRPRPGGGRLIFSTTDGYVYMIDRNANLYRYTGYNTTTGLGGTFTTLSPSGNVPSGTGESCALDPNDNTVLFAGTRSGIWRIPSVRSGSGGASAKFTGTRAPGSCQELTAINRSGVTWLFVAEPTVGVKRISTPTAAGVWDDITGGNMKANSGWCAIDSRLSGTNIEVVVGAANNSTYGGARQNASGNFEQVFIATTAQTGNPASWTNLTNDDTNMALDKHEGGVATNPVNMWYLPKANGGNAGINCLVVSGSHTVEQIRFHPANGARYIIEGGQQGAWMFDRQTKEVYPITRKLGVCDNTGIITDPNSVDHIYVSNVDHVILATTDYGNAWVKNEKVNVPVPTHDGVFCFTLESGVTISRFYFGYGNRDAGTDHGSVQYNDDPESGAQSVEVLGSAPSDHRPLSIAVRRIAGQIIACAGFQTLGIYRAVGTTANPPGTTTAWASKNGTPYAGNPGNEFNASGFWTNDSICVLVDRQSGVWRSKDVGQTWQNIWAHARDITSEFFACPHPTDPTKCYVTHGGGANVGLWVLGALDTGSPTVTEVKRAGVSFVNPSVVACNPNVPLVAVAEYDQANPKMWASEDGTTWTDITTNDFKNCFLKESGMSIAADGSIWISALGPGVFVGTPDSAPPPPPPDSGWQRAAADFTDNVAKTQFSVPSINVPAGSLLVVGISSSASTGPLLATMGGLAGLTWSSRTGVMKYDDLTRAGQVHMARVNSDIVNGTMTATFGVSHSAVAIGAWYYKPPTGALNGTTVDDALGRETQGTGTTGNASVSFGSFKLGANTSGFGPTWMTALNQTIDAVRIYKTNSPTQNNWSDVTTAIGQGRVPVVSFKPSSLGAGSSNGWVDTNSGALDAGIATLKTFLQGLTGPVVMIYHHEPEDDTPAQGTATQYRSAYARIISQVGALANVTWATCLMTWTFRAASGRNPDDWFVPQTTLLGVDGYWDCNNSYESPTFVFSPTVSGSDIKIPPYAAAKGVPWGIFECGAGKGLAQKPQWISELGVYARANHASYLLAFEFNDTAWCDWHSTDNPTEMTAWQSLGTNRGWT